MEFIIKQLKHCALVEINGRIDSYTSPRIDETIKSLIADGYCNLVIDLKKVTFISSSGILVLVNAQKKCIRNSMGQIVISSIPELVYSSFKLAGFDQLFEFYDDATTAVGSF
ncbi:MAG: STAS domain-containing protein [Chloroflexota bacterium]|nr:STAS domain-containing protein [Chloroflexota bacterium]